MTILAGPVAPAAPPKVNEYMPSLDGWRAIAVLLVILSHTTREPGRSEGIYDQGGFGVRIFFGLSGLLICTRLLREWDKNQHISLRGFYLRRLFRIFPAAWAYLFVAGLLGLAGLIPCTFREILACVFFYRNYVPSTMFSFHYYTAHYWSLAVEEHFYMILPAMFLIFKPRHLVWALPLFAVSIVLWRVLDTKHQYFAQVYFYDNIDGYFRTDHRLDGLLWGCWVAVLVWHFRGRIPPWAMASAGATAGGLLLQSMIWKPFVHSYFVALFYPGLLIPIVLACTVTLRSNPLTRLLEWSPLRWVGRLSYSLYLWQELFFVRFKEEFAPLLSPLQYEPWNWILLFCCAAASYYLVERPMIALGHRLMPPAASGALVDRYR